MNEETPFYQRLWFGVWCTSLITIVIVIFIGYKVVNNYEKERDEATTKTISEILRQESEAHPLLPDIIIVNISTKDKKKLTDSIHKEVSKYLIERYTKKSKDTSQIEIHPYVSFLEKSDRKPITGEQVEELKKHIQFLVNTCNKAVEDSQHNIDIEINKINTWVTIWVGVLGILGIFIPILVNIKSFDTLKEVTEIAKKVENKITEHEPAIEAIATIQTDLIGARNRIDQINLTLPSLTTQAALALENSSTAIDISQTNQRVVAAMEAILKLSKLQNIVLYAGANLNQQIHSLLSSFLRSFTGINGNYNEDLYRDLLLEFFDRITELSRSTILRKRINTEAISDFAVFLNGKIMTGNPLTVNDHNEIVANFEDMLTIFNN